MKRIKKFLILIFITLLILLNSQHVLVNADMGPKPSITIYLKNMKTSDYVIDLFEYGERKSEYSDFSEVPLKRRNNS